MATLSWVQASGILKSDKETSASLDLFPLTWIPFVTELSSFFRPSSLEWDNMRVFEASMICVSVFDTAIIFAAPRHTESSRIIFCLSSCSISSLSSLHLDIGFKKTTVSTNESKWKVKAYQSQAWKRSSYPALPWLVTMSVSNWFATTKTCLKIVQRLLKFVHLPI